MRHQPLLATLALAASAALASTAVHAQAMPSDLTLSFLNPTGTVSSTDSIDVWVRLTNTHASDSFSFDLTAGAPWGFDPGLVPLQAYSPAAGTFVDFDSYDYASRFYGRSCNDTFMGTGVGCSGGPYTTSGGTPSWLDGGDMFSLASGAAVDFKLYTLNPVGGMAPEGSYTLTRMFVGVSVHGQGTNPNDASIVDLDADIMSIGTCASGDPACGFTRTIVSVVPEPATWMAMLAGLGVLGAVATRRRQAVAAAAPRGTTL